MFYDSEIDFECFIGECLEYMANKNRKVLEKWCKQIGCDEPIGYYNKLGCGRTMIIYTTRPGALIGYKGKNVELLKEMLNKEFHCDNYKVEFIEIKGDIVNIPKPKRKSLFRHLSNLFRRC